MRYRYDRAASVSGARLIEAGTAQKATVRDLERAIGPQTAGILYAARFEGTDGILPLTEVVALASAYGIAVLVDAAAEVFPLERMTWLASQAGADLVCFGAKYFGAPQSAGVLCGKRALIEAAALNGFIAYETHDNRAWGRGYKVDRQEIVATVVALQEWFSADHQTRFAAEERRLQAVAAALAALPYVRTERLWPHGGLWHVLRVTFDEHAAGITPAGVHDALMRGDPPVVVRLDGDEILIAASTLKDGEEQILADRLRQALSGHR
jgi:L-seryl-tRNA(Ser) seleniumtransferase